MSAYLFCKYLYTNRYLPDIPGCAFESGSGGRSVIGPRLFIQFSIGRSCFLIQQFWKRRDGLLAVVEPSFRRQNRQLVIVTELVWQSDKRELMRDGVFVEGVSHNSGRARVQYIPPISPAPPAATFVFSGSSETSASVVSISEAIDAAF